MTIHRLNLDKTAMMVAIGRIDTKGTVRAVMNILGQKPQLLEVNTKKVGMALKQRHPAIVLQGEAVSGKRCMNRGNNLLYSHDFFCYSFRGCFYVVYDEVFL